MPTFWERSNEHPDTNPHLIWKSGFEPGSLLVEVRRLGGGLRSRLRGRTRHNLCVKSLKKRHRV